MYGMALCESGQSPLIVLSNKSAEGMHHTTPGNIFDAKTMHKSRAITQMKKRLDLDLVYKISAYFQIKGHNSVFS